MLLAAAWPCPALCHDASMSPMSLGKVLAPQVWGLEFDSLDTTGSLHMGTYRSCTSTIQEQHNLISSWVIGRAA